MLTHISKRIIIETHLHFSLPVFFPNILKFDCNHRDLFLFFFPRGTFSKEKNNEWFWVVLMCAGRNGAISRHDLTFPPNFTTTKKQKKSSSSSSAFWLTATCRDFFRSDFFQQLLLSLSVWALSPPQKPTTSRVSNFFNGLWPFFMIISSFSFSPHGNRVFT